MKPTGTTLGFGGALFAAALLVACGSGSGSSTLPSAASPNNPVTTSQAGTTTITILLPPPRGATRHPHVMRRRNYVSYGAKGLQVAVTSGSVTQTVYADIASPSPLCTGGHLNGPSHAAFGETCTITIPNVGASESVVATEVDQTPVPAASPVAGYGTGFPTTSNILAVGNAPVTITGSSQQVVIGLNPVAAGWYNCGGYVTNANFGEDYSGNRIVVTAGVAASGQFGVSPSDAAGDDSYYTPNPQPSGYNSALPFVDVNGSPTPLTFSASSADVTLAVVPNPSPTTSPVPSQTGSVPDLSYIWNNCVLLFNTEISASLPVPGPTASPSTFVTFANNLTAAMPSPFTSGPYGSTFKVAVVPISASPAAITVSVSAGTPVAVTGWDSGGILAAESAYGASDNTCIGSGAATITEGSYNSLTGQTPVTVVGTSTGTCTFYMYDQPTGVITNQVTVTINS